MLGQSQQFPSRHGCLRRHGLNEDFVVHVIAALSHLQACRGLEASIACYALQMALDDESSFMLVEKELDRVMPSRRLVMAATPQSHAERYYGPCGSTKEHILTCKLFPMQIALDDDGSFMLVEDELDRVMPSRRLVMAAGRYDLHHAIQYHGGYIQVLPKLLHLANALPIETCTGSCVFLASASPPKS